MTQNQYQNFKAIILTRLMMFYNKHHNNNFYKLDQYTKELRIENIFRQLDKTSLFILQTDTIKSGVDVGLFTCINNPNTFIKFKNSTHTSLTNFVNECRENKQKVFHSAYMTVGIVNVFKKQQEPLLISIINENLIDSNPIKFHNALVKGVFGIGNFMAHQIIINLQLAGYVAYDETYVKLGPGSSAGLKILDLPNNINSVKLLQDKILQEKDILELIPKTANSLAKPCEFTLETIENCLCIFQKMYKAQTNNNHKRKYKNHNNATVGIPIEKWYLF